MIGLSDFRQNVSCLQIWLLSDNEHRIYILKNITGEKAISQSTNTSSLNHVLILICIQNLKLIVYVKHGQCMSFNKLLTMD